MSIEDIRRGFIENWVRSYRYGKYRNYPGMSEEQARKVLTDTLTQEGPTAHNFWMGEENSPFGLIRVTDLGWDEIIYNMRMGNLTHVCGEIPLSGIRDRLTQAGYDHIVVRADSSDFALQYRLIREGFFLVDSILTYIYPRLSDPIENKHCPEPRLPFVFRDYEPGDREAVLYITQQMYAHYPSRYYRDPLLQERSSKRYLIWIEKYLDGQADKILVAELEGKLTAFMAYRYDRQLFQSTGIVSYGSGLGASTLEGRGAFCRVLYNGAKHVADEKAHYGEFETQIDNFSILRLYHQLGLRYVRSQYTFHLHLEGSRRLNPSPM